MQYSSQAVAKPYFITAIALFAFQILFGLILGLQYLLGDFLFPILAFSIAKTIHLNLLIMLILFGFMGASYYIVIEEAEQELHNPKLAIILFWIFLITSILSLFSYIFLSYAVLAKITGNYLHPTMGREFMEQPTIIKLSLVMVLGGFLYNIGMTIHKGYKTTINTILFTGLIGLTLLFLLTFYNSKDLVLEKFISWWFIHFSFEAIWLFILVSMLAFVLLKLTKINRESIEKWLYIIIALVLLSGVISTGHHYYWIGVSKYWQWWGTIFSIIEPIPLLMITLFVLKMLNNRNHQHTNKAARFWVLGTAVMAFLGAGVLGFLQSPAPLNYYTHGTQITVAHSHLAFYGTYVMIILTMISYAMPLLQGRAANSRRSQKWEIWSFWLMNISMILMTLFISAMGILQVYLQRFNDTALPFMMVQEKLIVFNWLREFTGVILLIGLVTYIISFFIAAKDMETIKKNNSSS